MSVPAPLPAEVLQLDISELQERLGDREWHPLNLSTLFIDPNKDWGFRIDNWYFIRKESIDENGFHRNSDESNFQYPSTIQPKTSVKVETEETFDTTNDLGITESSSIAPTLEMDNVTPLMTQESNSPTTIPTIEPIDSSENSSLVTNVSNFGNSANASDLFVEAP
ncbi:uncharacterized protein LOC108628884 isoform X2 [Ceratina calcarata]|nr:uncharacterized protein LOC108628884 isoform X2 [Ceratina calcarata]